VPHWLLSVYCVESVPVSLMLLMVSAVGPALLMVMLCEGLDVPTAWLPKATTAGLRLTAVPVPVKGTESIGLTGSELAMVSVALFAPAEAGVNVTVTEQAARGATGIPHVPMLIPNSDTFAPPMLMLLISRVASPVLVMISVWGALLVAFTCVPKAMAGGSTAATGAMPVPLTLAD
jgi:hypothetical protein